MDKRATALSKTSAHIFRRSLPLAWLFLLIEFFDELHYGVEGAILPALRDSLGLSYAQMGLLLGLPAFSGAAVEFFLMLLGDTRLRKWLVIGGGLAIALAALLLAGAQSFLAALLAFAIAYPASGAFVTLSQATLIDLNPGREPHMMARWTLFGSLGNLAGPLLAAGLFAAGLSWRWNYVYLSALALLLTLLLLPRRFPAHAHTPDDQEGFSLHEVRLLLPEFWRSIKSIQLMRWFILLDLSDLLLDVYLSYSALYFADLVGFTPAQVGLMMGALTAAGLAANVILIPLLEHVPGRSLVRLTAALAGTVYIAWLLAPWPWAKIVLAIVVRLLTLGWYEVLQGEAYASLPGRSGTVMAISSLMGLLGGALVWLVGWSAEQAGLQAAMWLLLAGPLALILFVPKPDCPQPEEPMAETQSEQQ
jgi:FSR family fosmidomycin resistance protein-like MFS transporter